jgi:hypothetical protein
MKAKIFSYKVDSVKLKVVNDNLKISKPFNREAILAQLKDAIKDEKFKIDENSLDYKIVDEQLYIEGLMVENHEPKSIGFTSGK